MSKWKDPIAEAERRGWNAAIEAAAEKCAEPWSWEGAEATPRVQANAIRQPSRPEPEG